MTIKSPNWCKIWRKSFRISNGKQGFPKDWMKCLEIARLQDFAPNTQRLVGALSGLQTTCRIERTPLWKFLPTSLLSLLTFSRFIIPHVTSCGGYNVFDPSVSQSVNQSVSPSVLFFLLAQLLWNRSTELPETL